MLAPRSEDQLTNILPPAPAIAAAGEQNDLGLVADGEAEADGEIRFRQ